MSDRRCTYRPKWEPCLRLPDDPIHAREDERMRPGAHVWRHDFDFVERTILERQPAGHEQ